MAARGGVINQILFEKELFFKPCLLVKDQTHESIGDTFFSNTFYVH